MSFDLAGGVLVTGATGFLGGALVRHLKALGVAVTAQGRNPVALAQLRAAGIPTLDWSFENPLSESQIGGLSGTDAVVHAAGLSSPFGHSQDFTRSNIEGTRCVLRAAEQLGARRFLFISSPSVYFRLQDQLDIPETAPLPRPYTHYARSKAEAEKLVLRSAIASRLILRPRGIYGPGETTLIPRLIQAASSRALPVFRGGVARIDLTYIDDVLSAIMAALGADIALTDRIYNVSGGESLPIRQIVEQCCEKLAMPVSWRPMRLRPALAAAFMAEQLALLRGGQTEPAVTRYGLALFAFAQSLNTGRARQELGWSPEVSFRDGLERVFAKGQG